MKVKRELKANIPNMITLTRLIGSLILIALSPASLPFLILYTLCGISDVLDGYIARRFNLTSVAGSVLDSISDVLLYTVMVLKIMPLLIEILPPLTWYFVALAVAFRIICYFMGALRFHRFEAKHTVFNKLSGFSVFLLPYSMATSLARSYAYLVIALAALAGLVEIFLLIIEMKAQNKANS